jgi:hypothetical protein
VSGSGTLLQAVLDASDLPARVVAVGADRGGVAGLERAEKAGVPNFVVRLKDHADRAEWDRALTKAVAAHEPDLVVSAGFMKILADIVLLTATQATTFRPDALSARHPQLVVLDLLYVAVAQRTHERSHAAFQRTAQAVHGHKAAKDG